MKKISLFALLAMSLGLGVTGCKDDTQPRLEVPTEFVLNTPAMADQTYIFRDDENYKNLNDITFTVSQPNYGLGTTPDYQVQIAKSEADFAAWDAAEKTGDIDADNEILGSDELPLAYTLETVSSYAQITIPGEIFCDGVNSLYGFDLDNYNHETVPVAVRVHAAVANAPQSAIWSNAINLNVSSYIPVTEPGKLYLIGQPTGWDINADGVYLDETGIGTKIFFGNVFIPAGDFQFRFYSALGDWESNAVGSQDADSPIDISFNSDGVYEGKVFMGKKKGDKLGKGSWQDTSWAGGNLEITVDLKKMTIKMQKAAGKKIYVIGSFQGWDITGENCPLEETPAGSNIYEGTFDVPAGGFEFAVYTVLGNWDADFLGPQGGALSFSLASGAFNGPVSKTDKGNWKCSGWDGGKIKITVDLNSNTINIEAA